LVGQSPPSPSRKTLAATVNNQELTYMAVWLYAYGTNGLQVDHPRPEEYVDNLNRVELDEVRILDSLIEIKRFNTSRDHYEKHRIHVEKYMRSLTADEYAKYLESIRLPYIEPDKIVEAFIEQGETREANEKENFEMAYAAFKQRKVKSQWKIIDDSTFVNDLIYFGEYGGFKMKLLNDLIWISGPATIFDYYGRFLSDISVEAREYYLKYFKHILSALKSKYILFTHEWAGLDDEEDEEYTSEKLEQQANWKITSSQTIHSMEGFYFEPLTQTT